MRYLGPKLARLGVYKSKEPFPYGLYLGQSKCLILLVKLSGYHI